MLLFLKQICPTDMDKHLLLPDAGFREFLEKLDSLVHVLSSFKSWYHFLIGRPLESFYPLKQVATNAFINS